jgi:choline-sulfatase
LVAAGLGLITPHKRTVAFWVIEHSTALPALQENTPVLYVARSQPLSRAALIGALVLVVLTGVATETRAAAKKSPGKAGYNVLLLMTDEHTPRVLGCYGDKLVKTPTLDSLAAAGVRFTSAYCQNPICVPSRVSLVSGRMPCHVNTFGNTANQKYENMTTLADAFVNAGYETAWFGKTHWGDPRFPTKGAGGKNRRAVNGAKDEGLSRLPQDSQVSDWPLEENAEHLTANEALEFLDQIKGRKFFLGVSFVKPHFPFTIQAKYYDMYKGKVSLPRASETLIDQLPAVSKQERAKYQHAEATTEEVLRTRAIYYGMVTFVDDEFGRILKKLDELDLRDNTIILYTADHGEMLGDRGIWYKNSFYDGSVGIPFIWSFPKALPRDTVIAAPVMNMDIFPTLCDLCSLPKPTGLEGHSLIPLMQGTEDGSTRYALSENYRGGFAGRMIRTPKWKYFFYTNGDEYLYDMESDPGEEHNLANNPERKALVAELKQKASAGWVANPTKEAKKGDKAKNKKK